MGRHFKCELCSQTFFLNIYLKLHQKTHIKEYECDFCGMKFSDRLQVSEHLSIHFHDKTFKCDVCEKIFSTSIKLKTHKKSHEGKVKCLLCDKSYKKHSISTHRLRHKLKKQEPKFKCNVCNSVFYTSHALKMHVQRHNNPISCDLCGSSYRNKRCFASHIELHNFTSSLKSLRRHLVTVHKS